MYRIILIRKKKRINQEKVLRSAIYVLNTEVSEIFYVKDFVFNESNVYINVQLNIIFTNNILDYSVVTGIK